MQDGLGLDERVMTGSDGTVGFTGPDYHSGFDDGHCAADTLIGDAGVGALEAVADADVTKDVVGKTCEQPHGIDPRLNLAAESLHFAFGSGEHRKKIVAVL